MFTGVPPIVANATSALAVSPGYLGSTLGFRAELRELPMRRLRREALIAAAGGVAGALLLLVTPAKLFSGIVPWLLLFATVLFAAGPMIARRAQARSAEGHGLARWREPGLLAVSIYGGYFNGGLGILLMALFLILYISGPIVRRPRLYFWLRAAFLSVTLVWTGWIAGAQLSIVQLVAFVQALIGGFNWDVFLLAPLIFVIWAFVALCILFWGRGVYCGWLCPFGALQELLHKAGQRLGVKRIEIPWEIHERLWPVKYIALLAIIAISLKDMTLAFKAAEIEPFKTAIILHFLRDWPFVLYAGVLLGLGLFVERFYCRYLCPLGAALAIPSKFKIFDWLTRRPQCGRECRLCATTCTVQAIDPIGRINPNECIYCLKCQVNYHDSQTCVPLKMRARRAAASPAAAANEV